MNPSIAIITLASITFIVTVTLVTASVFLKQEVAAITSSMEGLQEEILSHSKDCEVNDILCQSVSQNEYTLQQMERQKDEKLYISKATMFAAICAPIIGIYTCWVLSGLSRRGRKQNS